MLRGAVASVMRVVLAALVMAVALAAVTWIGAVSLFGLSASPDQSLLARIAVAGAVAVVVFGVVSALTRAWDRAPCGRTPSH